VLDSWTQEHTALLATANEDASFLPGELLKWAARLRSISLMVVPLRFIFTANGRVTTDTAFEVTLNRPKVGMTNLASHI
jgi:hypothetical protein